MAVRELGALKFTQDGAHAFEVGILDGMLDPVWCAERPGTCGATDL